MANAVAIWTHVVGQDDRRAPSPLAFVAAILHGEGSFVPVAGMGAIPLALARAAREAGVEFRLATTVAAIHCDKGRARGVTTTAGAFVEADAVVSNRNGVGTSLELVSDDVPASARSQLEGLPLQSPGVCAYLAVRGGRTPPYLRFRLPGNGELCRLLITPSALVEGLENDGWAPARLIAPMAYDDAQRLSPGGQREYLERVLAEPWWRIHVGEARLLDARTPTDWGAACHLYRESMNPVMTAQLMRAGRLAHRSPHIERLYLCRQCDPPGPVGELLCHLGHPGCRLCHQGPWSDATRHDYLCRTGRPQPLNGQARQRPAPCSSCTATPTTSRSGASWRRSWRTGSR